MKTIDLDAEVRIGKGKGFARKLRMAESIPAVLYGPKTESVSLTVPERTISRILSHASMANALYNLIIRGSGKDVKTIAMIKEVQRDPVSLGLLHVDFYEVDMAKSITVDVAVRLTGTPVGEEKGGVLEQIQHEISVSCLPSRIPEAITVDVSGLDLGDSVHVSQLVLDEGVEIAGDTDFTIATVTASSAVEELAVAEEEIEQEEPEAVDEGGES